MTTAPGEYPTTAEAIKAEAEAAVAERTIFFSDAVVAIAITLLALALPLPHGSSNALVLRSLADHRPDYYAFLISFVVIGNHWAAHRRLFRYVIRLDKLIGPLNMLWLLMMVITPFATRVLSGSGGFAIRFSLYALVQAIAGLCLLLMTREVTRAGLLRPGAPAADIINNRVPSLVVITGAFLISIPVAFVTQLAYLCWIAIPLVLRIQRRFLARPRPAGQGQPGGGASGDRGDSRDSTDGG
jgi:uncharacterized membrane protein